ncbi:MAG: acetolactate decarboxylase [bacterium]|nr:acetolactate decarboxylase [bacterium]MBU1918434.1 acetolactate decarboxylase [bacterium]
MSITLINPGSPIALSGAMIGTRFHSAEQLQAGRFPSAAELAAPTRDTDVFSPDYDSDGIQRLKIPTNRNILIQSHPRSHFVDTDGQLKQVRSRVTLADMKKASGSPNLGIGYLENLGGTVLFLRSGAFLINADGVFQSLNINHDPMSTPFMQAIHINRVDDEKEAHGKDSVVHNMKGRPWSSFLDWLKLTYIKDPNKFYAFAVTLNTHWARFTVTKDTQPPTSDFASHERTLYDKDHPSLYLGGFYIPESADPERYQPGFHFVGIKTFSDGKQQDGGRLLDCKISNITFLQMAEIDDVVILDNGGTATEPLTISESEPKDPRVPLASINRALYEHLPQPERQATQENAWMHTQATRVLYETLSAMIQERNLQEIIQIADLAPSIFPVALTRALTTLYQSGERYLETQRFHFASMDRESRVTARLRDLVCEKPSIFPPNVSKSRFLTGDALDPQHIRYLGQPLLDQRVDLLTSLMFLHHATPRQLFTLAQSAYQTLASGAQWLIHDLFMPDGEPYYTSPSHIVRRTEAFFPFEQVPHQFKNPPEWRKQFISTLEMYLRDKGVSRKDVDNLFTHVKLQDFPFSMEMMEHVLNHVGFETQRMPFEARFKKHPMAPYLGVIVAKKA